MNEKCTAHEIFPISGIFLISREPPQGFCSSEPLPLWRGPPVYEIDVTILQVKRLRPGEVYGDREHCYPLKFLLGHRGV